MNILDLKEVEATVGKGEAMRVMLAEAYVDLTAGTDDELRTLRTQMVAKHSECMKAFVDCGDKRYSSPEGNECYRDMQYYDGLIRRIEAEMSYRMIAL